MGEIAGTCLQSTLIILLPFLGCRMLISPLSSYWNLYMIFLKFRTNHTKWSNITFQQPSKERILPNTSHFFVLIIQKKDVSVKSILVWIREQTVKTILSWSATCFLSFQVGRDKVLTNMQCVYIMLNGQSLLFSDDHGGDLEEQLIPPANEEGTTHPLSTNWSSTDWQKAAICAKWLVFDDTLLCYIPLSSGLWSRQIPNEQ